MKKLLLVTVLLLLAIMLLVRPTHSTTTTLTGTIKDAQGNPLNGTLILQLPVPAQDVTTSTLVANTPVTYRVVNGVILGGTTVPVFDVANLQPQGLYYQARAYDNSGSLVFTGNYVITGGSFNLGAAVPTSITTSNISFVNPATQGGVNVFTNNNTFSGGTNLFTGTFISQSVAPAATGILRLANTDAVKGRNGANSADLTLLSTDASNNLILGSSGINSTLVGGAAATSALGLTPTVVSGQADTAFTVQSVSIASNAGQGLNLFASNAQAGNNIGGTLAVTAGTASGSGAGGAVAITAGGTSSGAGGNITLTPGNSGSGAKGNTTMAAGFLYYPPQFLFANLATPANGALVYCSDCTIANPCAGAGTGAMAKRLNGVWVCN